MIIIPIISLCLASVGSALFITQEPCHDVHIFLARGAFESYPGRQGALVPKICNGIPNCGYEDVMYSSAGLCSPVAEGFTNGKRAIKAYASRCPEAKLVLSGYSLGAIILGDIVGGSAGDLLDCGQSPAPALRAHTAPAKNIAAVMLWGDPRHVSKQPFNAGTGAERDGIWPRTGDVLSSLNLHAAKLRSWCNVEDILCAQGSEVGAHKNYFERFTDEGVAWARSKLGIDLDELEDESGDDFCLWDWLT